MNSRRSRLITVRAAVSLWCHMPFFMHLWLKVVVESKRWDKICVAPVQVYKGTRTFVYRSSGEFSIIDNQGQSVGMKQLEKFIVHCLHVKPAICKSESWDDVDVERMLTNLTATIVKLWCCSLLISNIYVGVFSCIYVTPMTTKALIKVGKLSAFP